MIYLLDTDTLIYMARGLKIAAPKNDLQRERLQLAGKIAAHCRRQQSLGHEVGLSAITVAELEYGAHRSGNYEKEIVAVRKILMPFVHFFLMPPPARKVMALSGTAWRWRERPSVQWICSLPPTPWHCKRRW